VVGHRHPKKKKGHSRPTLKHYHGQNHRQIYRQHNRIGYCLFHLHSRWKHKNLSNTFLFYFVIQFLADLSAGRCVIAALTVREPSTKLKTWSHIAGNASPTRPYSVARLGQHCGVA